MGKIQRAILSVTDKTGLVDFARRLAGMGVQLVSTGGTARQLRESGIAVKDISELTKFPEILDGRVKTLHPTIYAGLLAKRDKAEHMQTLADHALPEIDLVVCNLYPFEQTRRDLYEGARRAVAAIPRCKPYRVEMPIRAKKQWLVNEKDKPPRQETKEGTITDVLKLLEF
jgi:AICAR transformylase/IMP cyclohydrolase PurH